MRVTLRSVVDDILEITIEEPRIGKVDIRFLDSAGEPVEGRTQPWAITR